MRDTTRIVRWALGMLAGAGLATRLVRSVGYSLRGRVVLVTGGSRGLGLVLAREYAAHGARLVLVARSAPELERATHELRARGAEALPVTCDVTDDASVEAAVGKAYDRFGQIDVLVNNAGEIEVGPVESMRRDDWERAFETNFWGALRFTLAVLPAMRARGEGRIVNISSIGGLVAVPHLLPYTASKFALTGLSLGLRAELAKDGVRVITVCPGLMRTGSPINVIYKGEHRAEHAWFSVGDSLPVLSMSARRAARRIVRATRTGQARVILSSPAKIAALANALTPGLVTSMMAIVNRMLPASTDPHGHTGHESASSAVPSWLTALGDRAARANNELGPG